MSAREGQITIMVHGADCLGLDLQDKELDDRNYHVIFEPYRTERRLCECDGVITFQCLYERFERKSNHMSSWTAHSCDRDELDKREKELYLLIKNGGFVVFLLHTPFHDRIYENMHSVEYRDTDLVKRFLNWNNLYRDDYEQRLTSLSCVRDEFAKFFELYGAVWSSFIYHGSISWRNLALRNGKPVSMIIADSMFFVPCLLPDERGGRKEEFFRLLADAVISCVKKLRIELPPWADKFLLPNEQSLLEEQAQLSTRLGSIDRDRAVLTRYKRVLVGDGDVLVDDTINLLTNGLNLKIHADDKYREDFSILDDNNQPIVLGEIKGTSRGVKREYINQADSHRERAGLPSDFPSLVIINTHTKNARSLEEKEQAVPSEQVKHAANLNVLVLRTIDLLNLLVLVQKGTITSERILELLRTEAGWLKVTGDGAEICRE